MTLLFNIIGLTGLACLLIAVVSSLWGLAGFVLLFISFLGFWHQAQKAQQNG